MKLSTAAPLTLIYCSACAALEADQPKNFHAARDTKGTCSIGIGREGGSVLWDVTVYNCAQPLRQDINIIGTTQRALMDKGDTITVSSSLPDIAITNVDNAPVFNYDEPNLKAPLDNPAGALTKAKLQFKMGDTEWTSDDCGAGDVILSGGRESWTCDFPCTVPGVREL